MHMRADGVAPVERAFLVEGCRVVARYGTADRDARTVDRDRVTAERKHDPATVHRDRGRIARPIFGNRLKLFWRDQRNAVVRVELQILGGLGVQRRAHVEAVCKTEPAI